jgi:outer membrane protein OmpA-like peptidoglycan-associated protein
MAGTDLPASVAAEEVTAAAEVTMDVEDAEIKLVKAEVLSRIDVMPKLTDEEKDKLYVQVERARGMGKLMSVPFASGQKTLTPAHVKALKEKLLLPQFADFKDDPTVVFVVLGFADKAGDPAKNLALSRDRASAVVDTLKDSCGIMNVTHSVGMGSSEMFDAASLDKNRIVEIWAVLP